MKRKGISYIEIMIAFMIFIFGISMIAYFFMPYFKPEYYGAVNLIEKNFERKALAKASLVKVVINKTGCVEFNKFDGMVERKSLFFDNNFNQIAFSITGDKVTMNAQNKEMYLINSSMDINNNNGNSQSCNNTEGASVYYSPSVKEKIINLSFFSQDIDYKILKNELIGDYNFDFNITLVNMTNDYVGSIGLPLPKTNIFSKEKIYKAIHDGKIFYFKVRYYIW